VSLPILYKSIRLDCGNVADLIVADAVLLELKSVEEIPPVHEAQLLTYLRVRKLKVGLLLNFNVPVLCNGIVRRVL